MALHRRGVQFRSAGISHSADTLPRASGGPVAALLPAAGPTPGLADLRAAIALVENGLATRVELSGFPSWPGLLWQAYELGKEAHVMVLPAVAPEGGTVDIVVALDEPPGEPRSPRNEGG